MLSSDVLQRVRDLAVRTFDPLGIEVVEFKLFPIGSSTTFRFLVDRVGGVTLDECTQLNRRLGDLIDQEVAIQQSYVIEVSSPGLDRPLMSMKDFQRALGDVVRVWLKEPFEGKREWEGVVSSVNDSAISLTDTAQQEKIIPFSIIERGKRILA